MAQSDTGILGPTVVQRCTTVKFTANFPDAYRIYWQVEGGRVVGGGLWDTDILFDGDNYSFKITGVLDLHDGSMRSVQFQGTINTIPQAQISVENPNPVFYLEKTRLKLISPVYPACSNFTVVWQKSYDNITWVPIPFTNFTDATDDQPIMQTTYYRRFMQHGSAAQISNTVIAYPGPQLTGGKIGPGQSIQPGNTPLLLNNQLTPTGGVSADLVYGWESSSDELTWQPLSGAATLNYQPPALSATKYYRRKVTFGEQVKYSNTVTIHVNSAVVKNIPANNTLLATAPVKVIPAYGSLQTGQFNIITSHSISQPGITTEAQLQLAIPSGTVSKSILYSDGAGRAIQHVQQQASPLQKDIVSVNVYDQFGRTEYTHLPYVATTTTQNAGTFRNDASTAQPAFFKGLLGSDNDYFYSNTKQEKGGQSRLTIHQLPGKAYTGSNIGSRAEARTNLSSDEIKIWEIGPNLTDYPYVKGLYVPGSLIVSEIIDAEGIKKQEFKTINGVIICSKEFPSASNDLDQALITYYVFNDLAQIRAIVPPLAEKYSRVNPNFNVNEATRKTAKSLCYKFYYNEKGQRIAQQEPGAEFEDEFIYDIKGRLVFSRNSQFRSRNLGEWFLMMYDALDRPLISALYINPTATYSSLQALVNQASGVTQVQHTTPAIDHLVVDNREGMPAKYEAKQSVTLLPGFESEVNASFDVIANSAMPNVQENFTISNPVPGVSGYQLLTILYYDDYNFPGAKPFNNSFQLDAGGASHILPTSPRLYAGGMLTGSKTKVLGQDKMLTRITYYDEKGHLIQEQKENIAGGWDIITSQYDFSGSIISSYLLHKNPESTLNPEIKTGTSNIYSAQGQLSSIKHKIFQTSGVVSKEISNFTYDEAGQITSQSLGALETLNFTYSPLGQLAGINANYARNKTGGHFFGMEVKYESGFTKNRKDGLIAGIQWRRFGNPDEFHAFGFEYDGLIRQSKADYSHQNGNSWSNTNADFDVNISSYDENGNILRMSQNGMLLGNVKTTLDDLTYQYDNGGYSNKLLKVTDSKGNQQQGDFKDYNGSENDYEYDSEGNLTRDRNRGITIVYDPLISKPIRIVFDANPAKSIEYLYTVNGEKLKQIVKDGATTTTYVYINGFVYKNGTLLMFPHQKGRIRRNANGVFVYDYFINDNLGNTRTVITEESNIAYYKATHEANPQPAPPIPERDAFHFPANVDPIPAGHKFYDYAGTNRNFVKLNANSTDRKIGTSKVLRVMAGDKVETGVYTYYGQNSPNNNAPNEPINNILSSLINTMLGPVTSIVPNGHGNLIQSGTNQQIINTTDIGNFISTNQQQQVNSQVPKAYLNYVLFDDNFKLVTGGALRVHTPDAVTPLAAEVNVQKNGYIYIYISNESPTDVFFDDLVVKHTTGPLLQEDSYYPFGLGIRSLSAKALNRLGNKYLFNGIEKIEEHDLEIYDAFHRTMDPQIGRWWQRDPMSEKYAGESPWSISGNNAVNFTDPLGDDYFRNGKNVLWRDSEADTWYNEYDGATYYNIGSMFGYVEGEYYKLLGRNNLLIGAIPVFGISSSTENFTTFFHFGQQDFAYFLTVMSKTGKMDAVREKLFRINYSRELPYAKSILGGIDADMEHHIRVQSERQLLPTMRDIYAKHFPGRNRILTTLYHHEAQVIIAETVRDLVIAWLPHVWSLKAINAAKASTTFAGKSTTTTEPVVIATEQGAGLSDDVINLTTSSQSTAPSRTYTIFDGSGQLYKFGVTDANLVRYGQSLKQAGPGSYGRYSSIVPKKEAHILEKYLRSLHFNSTGQYTLPGMKVPYPVNFSTGLPIKP